MFVFRVGVVGARLLALCVGVCNRKGIKEEVGSRKGVDTFLYIIIIYANGKGYMNNNNMVLNGPKNKEQYIL